MANKDVSKDIRSAIQLEQELQISYAQHGVAVLDIYSSEWGFCKAISETFRRLVTDQGDSVHLRFFTVECNSVLASLKNDDHQRNPQRPKNIENIRDTLPEGWQSTLQDRLGQSKPFFLFYKEGKKAGFVEGVNTPQIRARVKELCTVKTPASDFITNSKLQEFWEETFNADESEVPAEKFYKGYMGSFKATVPLNEAEKTILLDALGVKKEAKEKIITAENLQKWVGDDETRSLQQIFNETLPEYEERAAKVMAEEKKQAAEDEARRRKEEEEARVEKERKAKEAEEESKRKAKEAELAKNRNPQDGINELMPLFPEFSSESEAIEGDSSKFRVAGESRNVIFAGPTRVTLSKPEDAEAQAAADAEQIRGAKSLMAELTSEYGLSLTDVKALVAGIRAKNKGSSLTGFASLSLALLGADENETEALLAKRVNVAGALSSGSAFASFLSFSSQAITTAADNNQDDLFYSGPAVAGLEGASVGDQLALAPLAVLSTEAAEGSDVTITFKGVANALRISKSVLNHWYSVFTVEAADDGKYTLAFQRLVQEDDFLAAATNYSTQAHADEKRFADLEKLQALLAEKGVNTKTKSPAEEKIEKPKSPEQPPVKPKSPEQPPVEPEKEKTPEKAKTPEKPKTPEQPPVAKPADEGEEFIQAEGPEATEEKPKTPEQPPVGKPADEGEEFIQAEGPSDS
jgi:hypothetical protein